MIGKSIAKNILAKVRAFKIDIVMDVLYDFLKNRIINDAAMASGIIFVKKPVKYPLANKISNSNLLIKR